MQLQTQAGGTYPAGIVWSNVCAGSSGTGSFTAAWQTRTLGPTNAACATLIDLTGSGTGTINLVYYGN